MKHVKRARVESILGRQRNHRQGTDACVGGLAKYNTRGCSLFFCASGGIMILCLVKGACRGKKKKLFSSRVD